MSIERAEGDQQIQNCFPVMRQLRPHLRDHRELIERVRAQQREGYQLAFEQGPRGVVCVAGFRVLSNLAWGRFLYVDDLVTDEDGRSQGYGDRMLQWLIDEARDQGCDEVHLDSGVQRFGAHRFYLNHRMDITSHHFAIKLRAGARQV